MAESPVWAAISAIKAGLSANKGYVAFHEAGGSVARGTWLRVYAEVKASYAAQLDEITRPLDQRPRSDEITVMTTKRQYGFIQNVNVFVKDRTTGEIIIRDFNVRTDTLLTRADVIETATQRMTQAGIDDPENYNEQVIGAVYGNTHLLVPSGLEE